MNKKQVDLNLSSQNIFMERVLEEGQWTLFGFLTRSFFMKVPKAIIIIVITGAFGMKIWLSRTIRYHRCVATNGSLSELTYFLLLLLEFSFLFIFLMAIVLTTMRRDRGKNTERVFWGSFSKYAHFPMDGSGSAHHLPDRYKYTVFVKSLRTVLITY